MKRNKIRIVCDVIGGILAAAALFIVLLLCNSADWLKDTFGELEFATVLYQLNSPLKGTGRGIVSHYLIFCLGKTAAETALLCCAYIFTKRILGSITLVWTFKIGPWTGRWALPADAVEGLTGRKGLRGRKWAAPAFLCLLGGFVLSEKAEMVGIPQYLELRSNPTAIYEERYVDPDSVSIEFPAQKKNLIYIYLESMETTYASLELGGGEERQLHPPSSAAGGGKYCFL